MAHLTNDQCRSYAADGYLVLQGAIPAAVLDSFVRVLEAEVECRAQAMYAQGEISDLFSDEPFATRWCRLRQERGGQDEHTTWHACVFSRALYDLWTHAAILDVVESLLGSEIQVSGDWLLRPKLPAEGVAGLPWHQDSGYMKDTGQYHWPTVWVPLVPVSEENGAMEFLPGTHRLPIREHGDKELVTGHRTPQHDPSVGREVVTMSMDRGDFVIFHNHLFHRSTVGGAPAVLGEGQLAAWKESLGADTAKWWRGHLRALRQNDAAGAKRADSGWGSVERAAVGAAWRIPIPAQVRGMVVGTLEVEWPPRHDSERAATSGPDTGATAAAASSCAPAPDPTS